MVQANCRLPRRSTPRQRIFSEMHQRLSAAADHPTVCDWQRELEAANQQIAKESPLFDRELFYAIQPRERLEELMQRYYDAFAG